MVENKGGDYEPLLTRGSSYQAPNLEATTVPYEGEEVVEGLNVQVVEPSAPTEEAILVGIVEEARTTETPHVLVTPTQPSDRDRLAEAAAAEAREHGVELIRSHLSEYLIQNPDANYVTWIATLHPENAEVTIDPRFLIPGNPWATVFEEARAAALMGVHDEGSESHNANEGEETKNDDPQSSYPTTRNIYLGGLIPMIVGFSILVGAVAVAFALQLASTIIYMFAVFFECICKILPRFSIWSAVLYLIPGSLLIIFQSLDILLLVLDTAVVEMLALLAYAICTPLAFSHKVGVFYHQQIRRLPHFIRWACRKPLQCDPPRATFPRIGGSAATATATTSTMSREAVQAVHDSSRNTAGFQRPSQQLWAADDDSSAGGIP